MLVGFVCIINTGITTKILDMQSKKIQSEDAINAENGTIKAESGYVKNVRMSDSLTLDIVHYLTFACATIENRLTVAHGVVDLRNVQASELMVKEYAVVYIFEDCTIKSIIKDPNAHVFFVTEYKQNS